MKQQTAAQADLVVLISSFSAINNVDGGTVASPTYADATEVEAALPTTVVAQLADGTTGTLTVQSWTDTDIYDASTDASYTFTVVVNLPADVDLNGQEATVEVVVAP
ncbi:Ig-like domain-containing protein [Peribacillus simplex]|uniref:Ig-like domain-containing protein n=1 Tax=Peribacillus simplex TaxID=1478 RepID=UPI0036719C4E